MNIVRLRLGTIGSAPRLRYAGDLTRDNVEGQPSAPPRTATRMQAEQATHKIWRSSRILLDMFTTRLYTHIKSPFNTYQDFAAHIHRKASEESVTVEEASTEKDDAPINHEAKGGAGSADTLSSLTADIGRQPGEGVGGADTLSSLTADIDAVSSIMRTSDTHLVSARNHRGKRVRVYWYSKINTQIVNAHAVSDEKHILLIHERPIAAQAQSALKSIVGKTIEVFLLVETLFDPTKHSLVPKHVLCSEEEKAVVLNEYKATEEMFPPIFATEIISRWFGAKRGQMFAIHRMDTVHPGTTTLVYRIVR